MKKFLRKLLSIVTITVIVNVVALWVLDATLLHSQFILAQAKKADVYTKFNAGMSMFLHQSEDENTRLSADTITKVVTPGYIEMKFSDYLTQLDNHYRHGAPSPVIDFSDLQNTAAARGLPTLPVKPITPSDPIAPQKVSWLFSGISIYKYGGVALSLALLALVAWAAEAGKRHRALFRTLLWSGVWTLPNWGLFQALPDVIDTAIKNNPQFLALEPALKALVDVVFRAVAKQFLYAAGLLAILAVVTLLGGMLLKITLKGRDKTPKAKKLDGGMVSNG